MKLSEVEPADVNWIWPQRFARGMLTIIEGMPGEGKGLITLDAAARVTKGWPFPPDPQALLPHEERPVVRDPASVLLISGEDSRASTEAPRAAVAGADLTRITAMFGGIVGDPLIETARYFADKIRKLAEQEKIGLIIIDPLEDAIPGLTNCDAATVRACLRPLIIAAGQVGAAIVGVRHLAKATSRSAITRGVGSIALSAIARFVFLVAKRRAPFSPLPALGQGPGVKAPFSPLLELGEGPGVRARIFACSKINICEPPPTLVFEIEAVPYHNFTAARVQWLGTSADLADDPSLFSNARPDSNVSRAELFLLKELSKGPVPTEQLLATAARAGLSDASLWRARTAIRVKSVRTGFGPEGIWSWSLPKDLQSPQPSVTESSSAPESSSSQVLESSSSSSSSSSSAVEPKLPDPKPEPNPSNPQSCAHNHCKRPIDPTDPEHRHCTDHMIQCEYIFCENSPLPGAKYCATHNT